MQRDLLDLRSDAFKERDWKAHLAKMEQDALTALPGDATAAHKAFVLCKCRYGFMMKDMDLRTFSAIRDKALKLKSDKRWAFMMREFRVYRDGWQHRTGRLA